MECYEEMFRGYNMAPSQLTLQLTQVWCLGVVLHSVSRGLQLRQQMKEMPVQSLTAVVASLRQQIRK